MVAPGKVPSSTRASLFRDRATAMRFHRYSVPEIDLEIIRILAEVEAAEPAGADAASGLHGYEIALRLPSTACDFVRNGTVYKALRRLRRCGAVESRWEDPDVALHAGRPRRRYHFLTENGRARARMARLAAKRRARLERLAAEGADAVLHYPG